jgi:lactate dehydrogenase-like 2-hydroxyacid dehydrogenase
LEELLRMSDIVSLHCPLTKETMGLIGIEQLQMMKNSALLINVARAKLVDPEALSTALRDSTIAGCAMDGYYIEPAPSPEKDPYGLLELPDEVFLVTSHLAYLTEDSIRKMSELAANSIINLLSGGDWNYVVNPDYLRNRRW